MSDATHGACSRPGASGEPTEALRAIHCRVGRLMGRAWSDWRSQTRLFATKEAP